MNELQLADIIESFNSRGVKLWTDNGKLKYKAAQGILSEKDIRVLKKNKEDIIRCLENENVTIISDKEHENEPFALTEIQQAYMLGRSTDFRYGGVACHIYMELKYDELDGKKVEEVWNQLIDRHPMLRSRISKDGYQCVMKENPEFTVEVNDFTSLSKEDREVRRGAIKKELDHKIYDTNLWPLYTVKVSDMGEYAIMHFSIDFLVADWLSIWTVLSEFEKLYFGKKKELPEVDVTFRDYLMAEQKMKQGVKAYRDKKYWLSRIQNMPLAPELPISLKAEKTTPRFIVSLGGATEGGIWSIYHNCVKGEMEKNGFSSIPYGRPLTNQGYIVLDSEGEECPVYVEGDLFITGDSLADGYFREDELTQKAFVTIKGERCYRTGDRGFYHRGGELEFTGRADQQVKLRGHRIELGEVESIHKVIETDDWGRRLEVTSI